MTVTRDGCPRGTQRGGLTSLSELLGSFNSSDLIVPFSSFIGLLYPQAGPADLKHFDPEFTQEAVSKSIGCTPDTVASSSGASSAFLGFSYAPDDDAILDC